MQETCNNCFGLKICSTTLRQAKTGRHECRNITAMYVAGIFEFCSIRTKVSGNPRIFQDGSLFFLNSNPVMFHIFRRMPCPAHFLEMKNVPCPFIKVKNRPYPFPIINSAKKQDSSQKS